MVLSAHSRLATLVLLLILQMAIFLFELFMFKFGVKAKPGYHLLRQQFSPIGIAFVGIILVSLTFSNLEMGAIAADTQSFRTVDADIAGPGVRIAAFVQVCVLILISMLGTFHQSATGAKEVGGGLVLTSTSLAIALIVRLARSTLTPVDAAIGAMVLDGQNIAMAIQLTAKETLASRWQVGISVLAQMLGLATISAIITGMNNQSYASDSPYCLAVFWWGWLGNCLPSTSQLEVSVFWCYLTCRAIGSFQASFHALWNTSRFDSAEKDTRDTADKLKKLGGSLVGITYPHFTKRGVARYGEFPATVTFMYIFYALFALTSLVNAEITIAKLRIEPSSAVDSTGQVIALVIAIATTLRVCYLFVALFRDAGKPGFRWPFGLGLIQFASVPLLIRTPSDDRPLPQSLPLGSMLRMHTDFASKYKDHVPVPVEIERTSIVLDYAKTTEKSQILEYYASIRSLTIFDFSRTSHHETWMSADRLEKKWFEPDQEYLRKCAELPEIQRDFGAGTRSVTVYLVVKLHITTGLQEGSSSTTSKTRSSPVFDPVSMGIPLQVQATSGRDVEATHSNPRDDRSVVYEYTVSEYILTSDGPSPHSVRANGVVGVRKSV